MNFNTCKEIPNKYLGSDRKKTILIDGERYLLKFPDPTSGYPLELELSYINNAISEYIGCKIYESLGIPVQDVLLGTYREDGKEEKVACACKDFCTDGYSLYEAEALLISRTEEIKSNRMELDYIVSFIDQMDSIEVELKKRFFDMFVVDCWICNADRHNSNWGILIHESSGEMKLAPVYDCGSSLSPLLADDMLNDELAREHALGTHSAIMHHGNRIWSSKFLLSCENKDLNDAVMRIVPQIDMRQIDGMIDRVEEITETRKLFYKAILQFGYDLVLCPTYTRLTAS